MPEVSQDTEDTLYAGTCADCECRVELPYVPEKGAKVYCRSCFVQPTVATDADIVERLRTLSLTIEGLGYSRARKGWHETVREAADTIERLREFKDERDALAIVITEIRCMVSTGVHEAAYDLRADIRSILP